MRPFYEPVMTGREIGYLEQALAWPNEGPMVAKFEERLSEILGVRNVICTTSGTAALYLAIKAAGFLFEQPVAIPDLTFIATAHAVTLNRSAVRLIDVDERGLCTTANIPVHVSGRLAPVSKLDIEDACEAFPSPLRGWAACYSFSPNKVITTGQGGAVATNDDTLAWRIRMFKDQGRDHRGTGGDDDHLTVGFNFKMTDLQAGVGLAQLTDLDRRLARQDAIHDRYKASLAVIPFRVGEHPLWTDILLDDRERVIDRLQAVGYQPRRFWKPLHTQPAYRSNEEFPNATRFAQQGLWLPSALTMTDDDVDKVIECVLAK